MPGIETLSGVIVSPAKAYDFYVKILRAPAGVSNLDNLQFRVKTAALPEDSSENIDINFRWMKISIPGRDASGHTLDISWWDGVDLAVYSALKAWRQVIANIEDGVQKTKEYITGDILLELLDGSDTVIGSFILYNAWIENLQSVSLDYSSSDTVNITATIHYDWYKFEGGTLS